MADTEEPRSGKTKLDEGDAIGWWRLVLIGFAVVGLVLGAVSRLSLDGSERGGGARAPTGASKDTTSAMVNLATDCSPVVRIPAESTVALTALSPQHSVDAGVLRIGFEALAPIVIDGGACAEPDDPSHAVCPHLTRVSSSNGSFEFKLERGAAVLRQGEVEFLLSSRPGAPTRLAPEPSGRSYEVEIEGQEPECDRDGKQTIFPAGTQGELVLGTGQDFALVQPISVPVWSPDTSPSLIPVSVTGQPGLGDVSVELHQPGLRFDAPNVTLTACVKPTDAEHWQRAGVSGLVLGDPGSAKVSIALPDQLLVPSWTFIRSISLAIATSDGAYVAVGTFQAIERRWAGIISLAVLGFLLGTLMWRRGNEFKRARNTDKAPWISGLFRDTGGAPSLSMLQVFIWTVVTLWGMIYVFIVVGNLLTITPQMLGLLGIAGSGAVVSRWVSQTRKPAPGKTGTSLSGKHVFWKMLSTNGSFDLLRLQLFVFTVSIAVYVIARIGDGAAFPELDANTLALIGLSQSVYVTGKIASTATPSDTAASEPLGEKKEVDASGPDAKAQVR